MIDRQHLDGTPNTSMFLKAAIRINVPAGVNDGLGRRSDMGCRWTNVGNLSAVDVQLTGAPMHF